MYNKLMANEIMGVVSMYTPKKHNKNNKKKPYRKKEGCLNNGDKK